MSCYPQSSDSKYFSEMEKISKEITDLQFENMRLRMEVTYLEARLRIHKKFEEIDKKYYLNTVSK